MTHYPHGTALAAQLGIETTYHDAWGVLRAVPSDTIERLSNALTAVGDFSGVPRSASSPATPRRCFMPEWMRRGERLWGLAAQLYAVRSAGNWGIGDFTDLRRLVEQTAAAGGDFVAINPLHAMFAAEPEQYSPYAPSSREFLNVLYIDVSAMRSYARCRSAHQTVADPSFQARLRGLRAAALVDYPAISACKAHLFKILFDWFENLRASEPDDPMAVDFQRYVEKQGMPLRHFAVYQALSCEPDFGTDWTRWPKMYRDPDGAAVTAFLARESKSVRYHAFLQWEADRQLADAASAARAAGMRIGLFRDLALGAPYRSADGWAQQRGMISDFHIGAPPDQWNDRGQDWGLAAENPLFSGPDAYRTFGRVLAQNMRHAGALRIDHVLGLNRLFLIPAGGGPADGAYLRYPAEALCGAVAETSLMQECMVVGEDLGTVPTGFRQLIGTHGILSYRLLIFATAPDGRFLAPGEYPADALVAISTHDLPTWHGFWSAHDIEMKHDLGLYPDERAYRHALALRDIDRRHLSAALEASDLASAGDSRGLLPLVLQFLARAPSRLLTVQLEDLSGELDQPNLPGTVDIHPNWRRRLSHEIDEIFQRPWAQASLAAVRRERPSGPSTVR